MNEINLKIQPGERWYGFCVSDGFRFPLGEDSAYQGGIDPNTTVNQASPFLVSSVGRYLWCGDGFALSVSNGNISAVSAKSGITLSEGHGNLRGAYLDAAQKYFPPSGKRPPDIFFTAPQFCTWIELLYNQNQSGVTEYAKAILAAGYPPGILMIDDTWMEDYGNWQFHGGRFPNPRAMVDLLHGMGFRVMLWTCPFISPDGKNFLDLKRQDFLLRDENGSVAIREWWNGFSAVLDLTNPGAAHWYHRQNRELMERYGVDGFKFDAGDGKFYGENDRTFKQTDGNGQTMLWAEAGLAYPYNEFRAGFRMGGQPLVQRLADKNHSWDENGMAALTPNSLALGIIGHPFSCPDMIGGGEYGHFTEHSGKLDAELFVRYAQCAALMPMMQFSAAPWRVLNKEAARLCRKAAALHEKFAREITGLADRAAKTGEPIVRYMEYQFPHQGMETINDQFMLGGEILAAPVLRKGQTVRQVRFPEGKWRGADGKEYRGGGTQEVPAPIECLPYFTKA